MRAVDLFCGAGGSSSGLVAAGIEVISAANHWPLAIETHNENHPDTDHLCADLRQTHPSVFPWTEFLWASPECTNHSLAKGKKRVGIGQRSFWGDDVNPAEERSRATMREVVEFAAFHNNPIIIVENVVDIRHWQFYTEWLTAMENMGYTYKTLYLNAQFFGVPQSRDRWYTVFWKKGNRAPDLDFRPPGWCEQCEGIVSCYQSWKNPEKQWGRYGARRQYVYRCPNCHDVVEPYAPPAASVIDWSLAGQRISERDKPLRPKTMERIRAGLRKFGRNTPGLVAVPHIVPLRKDSKATGVDSPLTTITSGGGHHALIQPHIVTLRQSVQHRSADEPLSTVSAGGNNHALIMAYYGNSPSYTHIGDPMPGLTAVQRHSLIELPDELTNTEVEDIMHHSTFRMLQPHELKLAMSFPDEYIVLGTKRDQVRQVGNAVACNVAQAIAERCIESLV